MSRLDSLRLQLLEAREARAAAIARLSGSLPDGHALVFLSLNVPGPGKNSARVDGVFERARDALAASHSRPRRPPTGIDEEGRDALGRWLATSLPGTAVEAKRQCVELEEQLPAGRLVDLDVYDRLGRQVDRASLGVPPRRCLVCTEPAVDCMRAGRHDDAALAAAVARLLHADDTVRLADALVEGARIELELTPKPGLVDRRDNGSHPDLSFELMERSVALLPEYYAELLALAGLKPCATAPLPNPAKAGFHDDGLADEGLGDDGLADDGLADDGLADDGLAACVAAGRRAEERMLAAIGTNAHRGFIFLSGLVLVGFSTFRGDASASSACRRPEGRLHRSATPLSSALADLARRVARLRVNDGQRSHGENARAEHGVHGIIGEALNGLPSIFEHGLPALVRAEARFGVTDAARHAAMATLMTVVEDTTTLHRCGAEGLERLKRDGRRILDAMESGGPHVALLERLNDEYRAAGMTMGGVADCLAITIALRRADLKSDCSLPLSAV